MLLRIEAIYLEILDKGDLVFYSTTSLMGGFIAGLLGAMFKKYRPTS